MGPPIPLLQIRKKTFRCKFGNPIRKKCCKNRSSHFYTFYNDNVKNIRLERVDFQEKLLIISNIYYRHCRQQKKKKKKKKTKNPRLRKPLKEKSFHLTPYPK